MTGLCTAVLLWGAALLLLPRSSPAAGRLPVSGGRRVERAGGKQVRRPGPSARASPRGARSDAQDLPLLIHQLTGLLAAGRAPHQLWADAAALQTGGPGAAPHGPLAAQLLPVLEAAAQAASLGLSPVPVFRTAAAAGAPRSGRAGRIWRGRGSGGNGDSSSSLHGLWTELAACVSVSERSGAPLAGVLGRYAAELESGLDQQAARETALAGPQATVRLLTWLPVGGLGLGYLLGVDPLAVLAGSPLGWAAAAAGAALSLIGRFWSRALVRQAAGP
ncbi:hypothetical protein QNO08_15105 [Arthrobacter sp. zg-Y820]|uniref:hypothetical protein n=1 Tax=unclassified Arthrobacter TaxID=235627 RepID=UPI00253FBA4B|nr:MULTISPECIES: hypothetical protein [unclassified Arthrobacter]MCC9196968.1 hypothetical protein [Arthrobacter sp. zg-Y820]MDK1279833.1 hypothetical protein [Arthrobacter sp. zg.Y820]WIB09140.1 hypothetical protein QNO08_15105 [Arthrobacter sp. zg-Y820]